MSQNVLLDPSARFATARALAPRTVSYATEKRVMDLLGSGLLLLALAPLFLVIALLVKLTSRGPVCYRSRRVGLGGEVFTFIKFRSMYEDAEHRLADLGQQNEKDGPIFKMKNDPRITPIGRILRKFSLDELPQILSVFTGEMSLVGPRPPLVSEAAQYDAYAAQRLTVKPGLTCFWQVMGRSDLSFEQWMDLDHRYLQEMSLATDLRLLAMTPTAVLRGRGAY